MKGVIFSDIDGTLMHKDASIDNLIKVPNEDKYISKAAIEIINEIRDNGYKFALITGRRESSYERISKIIPHDYGIIEHGCIIKENSNIDAGWLSILKPTIGVINQKNGRLWDYEKSFHKLGYSTDSEGRMASFRVYNKCAKQDLIETEKQKIENMNHPKGITTTRNIDMLDVLPECGSKANAIKYLMTKEDLGLKNIVCLGDDVNDLDMMNLGEYVLTLNNAKSQIKEIVNRKQGYISDNGFHQGTIDMLSYISNQII